MAESSIGVAVIGTGFGQKIHIPGLQLHPRTAVKAVYHRDPETARSIAQSHDIPQACSQIEEILALPGVQAVTIATPPFLHYEMAKQVLQAGKHLLLEKPTTLTVQEAIELYHLARSSRLSVTMDFEFRFIPAWQRLSELLIEGYVGKLRLVKVDWLASSRADAARPWNWYAQKELGGGALGSIGSHLFDSLFWLFPPVTRLCGWLTTSINQRPDPISGEMKLVDADDTCSLMLELADGTPCQAVLSAVTSQGRGHFVEVYGDRGTLILGNDNQKDYIHGFKLWGSQQGESLSELNIPDRLAFPTVYPDGRLAPFLRVIDRWVQGIDQGESLTPSLYEGVYAQLLMDLTHQSNETATWITVPRLESLLG